MNENDPKSLDEIKLEPLGMMAPDTSCPPPSPDDAPC